ncbi:MAG: sugar-binding protein [Victivallaceae bacterium]|nr:sugar-binding protein [Victivallaceae bacterium]
MNHSIAMLVCSVSATCLLGSSLVAGATAAKIPLKNLAQSPGVTYCYLDDSGNVIAPRSVGDTDLNKLTDGKFSPDRVATTKYKNFQKKSIRVRFEFPLPVQPHTVRAAWMWAHNPKQFVDEMILSAGNDPADMKIVGRSKTPPERKNVVWIGQIIPASQPPARFWQIDLIQEAANGHFMIGLGQVEVLGTSAQFHALAARAGRGLSVEFPRQYPCNFYETTPVISIPVNLLGAGEHDSLRWEWQVTDFFGAIVENGSSAGPGKNLRIQLKSLPPGHYQIRAAAQATDRQGKILRGEGRTSFFVRPKVSRSAAQSLAEGIRFGIQGGQDDGETRDVFTQLGLPWRRSLLFFAPLAGRDAENPDWSKLKEKIAKFRNDSRTIDFFEIKTVPDFCYDRARFGEKDKIWYLKMPQDRARYQKFIADQVRDLPEDCRYFELWNEPYGNYSVEDFVKLAQWMKEAIRSVRPGAKIGPNLDPMGFLAEYVRLGGMQDMDFLSIHPYSADFKSSPESAQLREKVRSYQKFLREKLGRDVPLFVTEIGWPTPPEGAARNSEREQACYTVRAALGLYAENVAGIMPYTVMTREENPRDREHYFGFLHRDLTPKPVLAAYANTAAMLEGAAFVGDLPLGTDVGAMLFRRRTGQLMLVLYTDGGTKPILLRPEAESLTLVDMFGKEKTQSAPHNRLSLTLTDEPIYLLGVGEALAGKTIRQPDGSQWSKRFRRMTRRAGKYTSTDCWEKLPVWKIEENNNSSSDFSAKWQAAWDEKGLYLSISVVDSTPGRNPFSGASIWKGDCIELFLSARPERVIPGFPDKEDRQILLTPFGRKGEEILYGDQMRRGKLVPGCSVQWNKNSTGYGAKIRLPWESIGLAQGNRSAIGLEIAVDNLDAQNLRRQISSNAREDNWSNSALWSFLIFD